MFTNPGPREIVGTPMRQENDVGSRGGRGGSGPVHVRSEDMGKGQGPTGAGKEAHQTYDEVPLHRPRVEEKM